MSTETTKAPLEPTTLSVQGMTCSSCVNSVEKALNSVEGVSATINFATETAHILAPAEITAKELIKIVEKAGYSASLLVDAQSVALHSKKSARAFFFAAIFAIPAVDTVIRLGEIPNPSSEQRSSVDFKTFL